jgi:hypothetical protein
VLGARFARLAVLRINVDIVVVDTLVGLRPAVNVAQERGQGLLRLLVRLVVVVVFVAGGGSGVAGGGGVLLAPAPAPEARPQPRRFDCITIFNFNFFGAAGGVLVIDGSNKEPELCTYERRGGSGDDLVPRLPARRP